MTAEELADFIKHRMRMSHIYQPVMLKVLLESGGQASVEDIAKALLSYDKSQVEYYGLRTKNMVGKVLTDNHVVEPVKSGRSTTGYKLKSDTLTEAQRASLKALCDQRLRQYIEERGAAIWATGASQRDMFRAALDTRFLNGQNTAANFVGRMKHKQPCTSTISSQELRVDQTN